ncbi:hypothetical protein NQ176_g7591 [Zarea fungicola]|uniref:Uncharacterized protein n=1 Tax=Zarea fungicola TaxID=93591 RepID=A0ACC1MYE0_9HYPO|nr:hypothetical protein NQ176_g7591 [Lecanicillium fungicola]
MSSTEPVACPASLRICDSYQPGQHSRQHGSAIHLLNAGILKAVVAQECITAYNDLKLSKKFKYIIYKLSDDNKEIVVEEASADKDWDNFREKLINAKSKSKSGAIGKGPRYAVYDFEYNLASGDGIRNKIVFIAWSPDDAGVQPKMIYASSKEALKRSLTGIASELQANDSDDIEYDTMLKTVSKGLAA